MIRIFLFIIFIIISNKSIASIQGVTLICDNDRRGYNFKSTNKVFAHNIYIYIYIYMYILYIMLNSIQEFLPN